MARFAAVACKLGWLTLFYQDHAKPCNLEAEGNNVEEEEEILLGAIDDPTLDNIVVC